MGNRKRGLGKRNRNKNPKFQNQESHLFILDTECTEKNYLDGIKKRIQKQNQNVRFIYVKSKTENMVERALQETRKSNRLEKVWLVFDRDKVKNFDDLIFQAKQYGFEVLWSNPCIEVWFGFYFGKTLFQSESSQLVLRFKETFFKNTGIEYKKSDSKIYSFLEKFGDEKTATKIARNRYYSLKDSNYKKPSDMISCTTFFKLIEELQNN